MARKIFLCEDRNVITGDVVDEQFDAVFVTLKNAAVVRIYGTTKGLGELAMDGPTPKTILDRVKDGHRVNLAYVIYEYACNDEAWKKWIKKKWQ